MARLNESDAWRVLGPQSGDDGHWTARLRCHLVDSGGVVFLTANKRHTRCFRVCGKQIFGGISDFTLTISSIVETCWSHQPVQFGHEQRIFCSANYRELCAEVPLRAHRAQDMKWNEMKWNAEMFACPWKFVAEQSPLIFQSVLSSIVCIRLQIQMDQHSSPTFLHHFIKHTYHT